MVFDNYAKYYNLLYKDKNYNAEVDFVHSLIQKYALQPAKSILDIGCGTGIHASFLSQLGYSVTGVDLSEQMVSQAISKGIPNAEFHVGNATDFRLGNRFDVVVSLFHVLSYQTSNEKVKAMLATAASHLKQNGLFVFDFWYGPAVLTERPAVRIKRLEDDEISVTRLTEPALKVNENTVDVNFELMIQSKADGRHEVIHELHAMRYFFKPEIELLVSHAGLELVYFQEWLTGENPSENTWGVCCVAVKK